MDRVKLIFVYISLGLSFFLARGQQIGNYVNNGSFELALPGATLNPYDSARHWSAIDSTQNGSYRLYSLDFGVPSWASLGFQMPKTGRNFIASQFYCTSCPRWYPRNRLKQALKPNGVYCATYHVVNTNNNRVAIENYGMYFGTSILDTITKCSIPLTYLIPQIVNTNGIIIDTLNWIPITGTFVASGTEKYLVLGNFKSNATTNTLLINTPLAWMSNDIYIDDVSIVEVNLLAYAGPDKSCILGDSVFIGRLPDFAIDPGCVWYKLPNMTTALDTVSGLWVKPSATSTYVVRQELDCSSLKWDTVVVTINTNLPGFSELQMFSDNISLFPNPTSGNLSISGLSGADISNFYITNSFGQIIRKGNIIQKNNLINVETSELESGLYQIHLKTQYGIVTKKFVKTN